MTKIPPYREIVPLGNGEAKLRVNFHDGQRAAWNAAERDIVVSAGTQSGKTCFGPDWLYREVTRWQATNPTEPGDFLAVSPTYPLMNLKMLPQLQDLLEHTLKVARYKASDRVFESLETMPTLGGGKRPAWKIFLGSAENPDSLESATAIAAWLDEPGQKQFKRSAKEAIDRRVSLKRGRRLYTTTPYVLGWFKQEVYDRALNHEPGFKLVNFKSTMNPAFSKEEYEDAKSRMPRWKFRMFYDGVFERPAGLIYDCFDPATQVIPRFEIPLSWPRYWGHDFGPVHTAAVGRAIEPATGNIFTYYAYKSETKGSAHDHVVKWRNSLQHDAQGKIIETIFKRVGGAHGETGWRESYTAEGWPIVEPKITGPGSVELQIDRVYGLRKLNKEFVFSDLTGYLDELQSFSRELDDNYQPTEKIEDEASKHWMACDRYILSDFTPETVQNRTATKPKRYAYA